MGVNVTIDTGGLSAFIVRLREVLADLSVTEEKALLVGAEVVKEEAKQRTDSVKTRDTIRVIPLPPIAGRQAVAVGAGESGGSLIPLLLEGGNGIQKFSSWKHPVFGNLPLEEQKTHPYLLPSLRDKTVELTEAVSVQVEDMLDDRLDGKFTGG